MVEAVFVAALTLLVAPGVLGRTRLSPARRVRLMALSLVSGVAFAELGLLLLAAPTALRSLGLVDLANRCRDLIGLGSVDLPVVGWSALIAATAVPTALFAAWRRCRRTWRDLYIARWLGERHRSGTGETVVLPSFTMLAYGVPGDPDQVVVSEGLVEQLSPAELRAVICHERAHLALGHRRYLTIGVVVERALGWIPGVGNGVALLRLLVERWADEAAVEQLGSHEPLADALRSYLFADLGAMAFSASETVDRRLRALREPERRWRTPAYVGVCAGLALVWVVALVGSGSWLVDAAAVGPYCVL
jgi:Zn-dependent protease with chaperone function